MEVFMDYSYIKKEVENNKPANHNNFIELYERQKKEVADKLSKHIVDQVKNWVKNYYEDITYYEEVRVKDKLIKSGSIKAPTLFRRYYLLQDISRYAIITPYVANNKIESLYRTDGYTRNRIYIPGSKLSEFRKLLNQYLKSYDISVKLKYCESHEWYNILIVANVGKL